MTHDYAKHSGLSMKFDSWSAGEDITRTFMGPGSLLASSQNIATEPYPE
jgi:hypothetical protein